MKPVPRSYGVSGELKPVKPILRSSKYGVRFGVRCGLLRHKALAAQQRFGMEAESESNQRPRNLCPQGRGRLKWPYLCLDCSSNELLATIWQGYEVNGTGRNAK